MTSSYAMITRQIEVTRSTTGLNMSELRSADYGLLMRDIEGTSVFLLRKIREQRS